jgi:hypothetical protein
MSLFVDVVTAIVIAAASVVAVVAIVVAGLFGAGG